MPLITFIYKEFEQFQTVSVFQIREIMESVNEDNDQSLDEADLDACCARILMMLRKLC